jgi:O-succinylbenzoate synthase
VTGPEAVELRRLRLPLVEPFGTAHGTQHERDVLLVRVLTSDAEGWGECAALSEPTYTAEYTEGAADVLRRHLVPRLFDDAGLDSVQGHPMAKAALRAALLDAALRGEGRSLKDYLGAARSTVPVGVSVGLQPSLDAMLETVARYVEQGYARVKLKIQPGWDVEPVSAVRDRFGPRLQLQVDANGSYTVDDARHLQDLDSFALVLIEQPLPADDLLGHVAVAERITTPVCLDESIGSAADADTAIRLGACRIVNIKAGRVGGLDEAVRIHDLCQKQGVPVWCGGMLETGVGRAAALALAALPNFTLPADLSASDRYYREDLTDPFVLHDGCLTVPDGPGIGVTPHPEALAQFTTSVEQLVQ